MINISFVKGEPPLLLASDSCLLLEKEIENSYNDIDSSFTSFFESFDQVVFESELMGEISSDKMIIMEAEANNIFAKIGNAIVENTKKLIAFINSIIDKFKNFSFSRKSDLQKVETLCKEHPEFKEKIMKAFNDGDLSLPNVKSLQDLEDEFENLCKMARKKDIKPGSLEDKLEKMKKKFENIDKSTVIKVASATAVVVGLIATITNLNKTLKTSAEKSRESLDQAINDMKTATTADTQYYNENMSKTRVLYNAHNFMMGKFTKAAGESQNVGDKAIQKVLNFADQHQTKASDNFHSDIKKREDIKKATSERNIAKEVKDKLDSDLLRKQTINNDDKYKALRDTSKPKPTPKPKP